MEDLKISIRSIIVYELIMIIGSMIMSSFDITSDNKLAQLIGNSIIQLISSGYIVYIIKKFYKLENIGFSKIKKDKLVWFVPYIFILIPMLYKFIEGIYKNISYFNSTTLIKCVLETGRTHQIRVHLSHIGFPIIGDMVYSNGKNEFGVEGQCLHAKRLEFLHPITEKKMILEAPLPEYFENIIKELEERN